MKKYLTLLLIAAILAIPVVAMAEAASEPAAPVIDLTILINGLLTLILGWIARYVVPFLKSRLKDWQFDVLYRATAFIVESAEQQFGPGKGRDKLEYTTKRLMEQGYAVDLDMIESIVRGLRENLKPTTTI